MSETIAPTSARPVVTRFAPSPTGELHVGGARTALFSWAYARRHGGKFLLRLEDTDQKRSSDAAAEHILRDLAWLGLTAENVDDIPRQSQRLPIYDAVVERLLQAGLAYEEPAVSGGARTAPDHPAPDQPTSTRPAVRFRMGQPVEFDDAVYGHIRVEGSDLEDFIIRKSDGFPTFHLAVIVDDADMAVTHVIRGQEHLSNTAKHAALCDALGYPRPVWCHTPSILNPDGSKMSKRDKAKAARQAAKAGGWPPPGFEVDERVQGFLNKENDDLVVAQQIAADLQIALPEINVADFRRSGYTPEVLLNYLALLGWNPGENVERFDLHFMAEHFDFGRIGKSNSKFDRDKLAAFSQDTLLQVPLDVFAQKLRAHFDAFFPEPATKLGDKFALFAGMYKERSRNLSDSATLGRFFFVPPETYDEKAVRKNLLKNDGEGLRVLSAVAEALSKVEPWEATALHAALDALWPKVGGKNMGAVAQPLRVALAGVAVTPEIGPTLELLGRDESLNRIAACEAAATAQRVREDQKA